MPNRGGKRARKAQQKSANRSHGGSSVPPQYQLITQPTCVCATCAHAVKQHARASIGTTVAKPEESRTTNCDSPILVEEDPSETATNTEVIGMPSYYSRSDADQAIKVLLTKMRLNTQTQLDNFESHKGLTDDEAELSEHAPDGSDTRCDLIVAYRGLVETYCSSKEAETALLAVSAASRGTYDDYLHSVSLKHYADKRKNDEDAFERLITNAPLSEETVASLDSNQQSIAREKQVIVSVLSSLGSLADQMATRGS